MDIEQEIDRYQITASNVGDWERVRSYQWLRNTIKTRQLSDDGVAFLIQVIHRFGKSAPKELVYAAE